MASSPRDQGRHPQKSNNSQQGYPQQGYPQPGYPQPGYSQPGYSPPGYSPPGYPPPGYPQPGYPQPMYPQPGYPQPGYLQPGYPQQGNQPVVFVEPVQDSPTYRAGRAQNVSYEDDDGVFGTSFDDKKIRAAFVQKVYLILTVQLIFTAGICSLFMYIDELHMFVLRRPYLIYVFLGIYMVFHILLVCCKNLRRQAPCNFILLGLLTVGMALTLGVLTAHFETLTVLMALGTTILVCFLVSLFACQTKCDITGCGVMLCLMGLAFIIFTMIATIISVFVQYVPILHTVIAGVGTGLFCLYLMYDTQQVMGGRRIELSPEEYILGALQLYMDMVIIFQYILILFSRNN